VTVNKLRFRHPVWLFGMLALIVTAPVIAGSVRGHLEQGAGAAQSGQATVPNPNTPPGKPAPPGSSTDNQRGGGRPDFAQAGGKNPENLDGALQSVYNIVAEFLG